MRCLLTFCFRCLFYEPAGIRFCEFLALSFMWSAVMRYCLDLCCSSMVRLLCWSTATFKYCSKMAIWLSSWLLSCSFSSWISHQVSFSCGDLLRRYCFLKERAPGDDVTLWLSSSVKFPAWPIFAFAWCLDLLPGTRFVREVALPLLLIAASFVVFAACWWSIRVRRCCVPPRAVDCVWCCYGLFV